MKSKRSKACDITQAVKKKVWERDGERCVVCGNHQAMPNAHYIPRSKGGLGIEQNIVTLCLLCHHEYDNSSMRTEYKEVIREHLKTVYGDDWDEEKLIYKKI